MYWLMKSVPYACLYIDISWRDAFQCLKCIITSSENKVKMEEVLRDLQNLWTSCSHSSNILVTLSFRSALDMYLKVKNFPAGSEVIMTSINIPNVASIVVHHGLVVVPCDIDPGTLAPDIHKLKECITEKTVAILVAHIYGRRMDMAPIVELFKPYKVQVIEDCAEGFSGLSYTGHEGSDIATFSFGTIKHCTAFGGALSKIKSRETYESMAKLQEAYPEQSRFTYALKFFKCCIFACVLNIPMIVRLVIFISRLLGIDHKKFVVSMLRGFPKHMLKRIRHKPCLALLKFLYLRLSHYESKDYALTIQTGDYVRERLPVEVLCIGRQAHFCGYWLYPILVERPDDVVEFLSNNGIDATRGSTQLKVMNATVEGRSDPILSRFIMDHVVYLPVHKRVPFDHLDEIVQGVKQAIIELGCKRLQLPKVV